MAGSGRHTDVLLILGIYCLAHAPLLLVTGIYWDDWEVVGQPAEAVASLFREMGLPMIARYHLLLEPLGILPYRLAVFLSGLASALCLYGILGRMREIDRTARVLLVLVFILFPANSARVSIVASWYPVSCALFFGGFWLVAVYLDTRSVAARLAALGLLFASFHTQSLLVYYLVVVAYIAWRAGPDGAGPGGWLKPAARHLDFLLLPIVFWIVKRVWFEPFGGYRGYNRVTLESALQAFAFLDNAVLGGLVEALQRALRVSGGEVLPLLAGTAALAWLLRRRYAHAPQPARTSASFVALGVLLFGLGSFPYLAVGKVPGPDDWDSRFQLLTPLGAAFMLVYLVRLLPGERCSDLAYAALIVVIVMHGMRVAIDFQKDWYKQVALIESFRTLPAVRSETRFLIDDRARSLDANRRQYRYYEYGHLLHAAFGDRSRSARAATGRDADADAGLPTIVIDHGALQLTLAELARLRLLESRDPGAFRARAKDLLRVSIVKP